MEQWQIVDWCIHYKNIWNGWLMPIDNNICEHNQIKNILQIPENSIMGYMLLQWQMVPRMQSLQNMFGMAGWCYHRKFYLFTYFIKNLCWVIYLVMVYYVFLVETLYHPLFQKYHSGSVNGFQKQGFELNLYFVVFWVIIN